MLKLAAVLVAGAAGGFLVGSLSSSGSPSSAAEPAAIYFDESAPVDERITALERIVAEERNARLVLEEQITLLLDEIDRIDTAGPEVIASRISEFQEAEQRNEERAAEIEARREMRNMNARERQLAAMTAGGFTPDRANQILDRASALQWELMQEYYEAESNGTPMPRGGLENNPDWRLRQELGDAEYERYLAATGRPTEIAVREVMASSPASRAGLQAGDVIVSYDGTRIFNAGELRSFAMTGSQGDAVVVEIVRDGNRMQLVLPAGPMGIQMGPSGRANRAYSLRN